MQNVDVLLKTIRTISNNKIDATRVVHNFLLCLSRFLPTSYVRSIFLDTKCDGDKLVPDSFIKNQN